MIDPRQFAMAALNANPKYKNSPMGKQLMNCLQNNDNAAGEQLANNILGTYGLTKEQGTQQAAEGLTHMFKL